MESTHSRQQKSIDSTYPLPSLCSSISSSNSTLHDMSTTTTTTNITDTASTSTTTSTITTTTTTTTTTNNDTNNNRPLLQQQQQQQQQQPHQRWDESQLALELADDTHVPEHKSFKQSAKHLKHKILKSFQPTEQETKSIRYKKWKHLLLKS
ncbi:hypothetical protein K501DRAFT_279312 [Backusella circina FSU 941]|nr:hypothetical protein K501DRAFT_279312 [Backusella circina FSU 941]